MNCYRVIVRPMQNFVYTGEWEEDVCGNSVKEAEASLKAKYPNKGMHRYSFEFPDIPKPKKREVVIKTTKKKK